jgi:hypothetical protein
MTTGADRTVAVLRGSAAARTARTGVAVIERTAAAAAAAAVACARF